MPLFYNISVALSSHTWHVGVLDYELPAIITAVKTYNGNFPGSTIEAVVGEPIVVQVRDPVI